MRGTNAAPPTAAAELYASNNGMLSIRYKLPEGQLVNGRSYRSQDIGTSQHPKGRKIFERFLQKHAIKGIDPKTVEIQSTYGPVTLQELETSALGTIMKNRYKAQRVTKPKRLTPTPWGNGHDTGHRQTPTVMADHIRKAKDLIQVLGTSLASAATALRMLEEELGSSPPGDLR